jgi:hypothetical protein
MKSSTDQALCLHVPTGSGPHTERFFLEDQGKKVLH